jgi:regulator of protease activity HflC (stomatin/prohibitin superfamily)
MLAVTLTGLSPAAWCGYTCKPPNSTTIYRDDLPIECKDVEIREFNPDGSLRRIIPPLLTPEQKKEKAEKEKRLAACIRRNQDQERKNAALRARYNSEDDLQGARYRELARQHELIDQQRQKLAEYRSDRERLDDEKEFHEQGQLAEELKRKIDNNDDLQARTLKSIEKAEAGMQQINDRYDADLKGYRELVDGTEKPAAQCDE